MRRAGAPCRHRSTVSTPVLPVLLLATASALAAACVPARPPAPPAPAPTSAPIIVPGDTAALAQTIALADTREWIVRVVTVQGDTLAGRVGRPAADHLRIRLRDFAYDAVLSLDRRVDRGGGLYETRLLAGAAVGAMVGLVVGYVVAVRGDLETGSVQPWMLGGAIVGLLAEAPRRPPAVWLPLWRRQGM